MRGTLVCLSFVASMGLFGCGGDGGPGTSESSLETGTVAVLLADGPADAFDAIFIRITEIALIPARGPDAGPGVVIFRSEEGLEVDILKLRDEDLILAVDRAVPARRYEKVRLQVADIRVEGGPCAELDVKLPSGKIDLVPRGTFQVSEGEALVIRVDVDANKSIQLHVAGRSGKCIFRPVVFADIVGRGVAERCPRLVEGTISRLLRDDDDELDDDGDGNGDGDDGDGDDLEEARGFVLDLAGDRGTLVVKLETDTLILDPTGAPLDPSALAPGDEARVRGRFDDGRLTAAVVVVGEALAVGGTVETAVADFAFDLQPSPGEPLDERVTVVVTEATPVFTGCDTPATLEAIVPGSDAVVVGTIDEETGNLIAAVVFVGGLDVRGELIEVVAVEGGHVLRVRQADVEGEPEREVFLPDGTNAFVEGDGQVDLDLLAHLAQCKPRGARLILDPDDVDPAVATAVTLDAEQLDGAVSSIDPASRTLVVDGAVVRVSPSATILRDNQLLDLSSIAPGDDVRVFGLEACPEDEIDFHAFVVLVLPEVLEG